MVGENLDEQSRTAASPLWADIGRDRPVVVVVGRADTTVLIARAGRTHIGAMRAAVAQTEAAGGNILGIALNYVLPRWQSYTDSLYFNESKSYYSVS